MQTMQSKLFYFTGKSLYMFRVSLHPSSGVLKTVTAASGTGHNIGPATSFPRGQVDLATWKIMNEDAVLIPKKNRGENFSSGFLHSEFFGGRGEPLCRHSIDCCFVSGSSWYNQVLSMVTNRDRKSFGSRRKNSKSCSNDWHR